MGQAEHMKAGDVPAKRGRGRPRVENPLSAAERAKRYRDRKRQSMSGRRNAGEDADHRAGPGVELARLKAQILTHEEFTRQWQQETEKLTQENADLRGLVDMFIEARLKRKPIPADVFRNICASYLKK